MTFVARAPGSGDQPGQRAIAGTVGGERHELERIGAVELSPDDERQLALLGCDVRTHHACERAFIGESERSIVQTLGLLDELLAVRGAAQKREIAQRMQLGVHARASSEHTVQIPTPRQPLLKNPQSRSPCLTHDVIVAGNPLAVPPAALDALGTFLDYLRLLEEQRVQGVVITPATRSMRHLQALRDRGTLVVLLDRNQLTSGLPARTNGGLTVRAASSLPRISSAIARCGS